MEIEFARALSGLNVSSNSLLGIDQVDWAASSSYQLELLAPASSTEFFFVSVTA
jgi:hypothetical protein